jgi:hypothetical protein
MPPTIPLVDISPFLHGTDAERRTIASTVEAACADIWTKINKQRQGAASPRISDLFAGSAGPETALPAHHFVMISLFDAVRRSR